MRPVVRLALVGLARAPGRTLARALVLAAAAALLASMILFIGASLRTMTAGAVRSVPLHWQGPVSSYAKDVQAAAGVAKQRGVLEAVPAATAPLAGAEHTGAGGTASTGKGGVLAVGPNYLKHISTFRMLHGSVKPGGVVLDQQMAATLQASIGDTVKLRPRPGAPAKSFKVSGVGIVTAADVLFQPLNPQTGPAPAQPPANIAILDLGTFARDYAPALRTITPASVGSSAVPGAQDGVQWQVQAQVDPAALKGSPSHALKLATGLRGAAERSLPGQITFVDNLSDGLNTSAGDALYAEAMYILLAVPGALVALGLAYLAALGTVERDRRELALLRARGARRRDVLALGAAESVVLGVVGGLVGAGVGILATSALVKGGVSLNIGRVLAATGAGVLLAILGALAARLGAVASVLRTGVAEGQRGVQRTGRPLWQRLYLDVICLAVSGLVYWLTARTGFAAVVNPDANPTLSLSVYMFLAPALLWLGAALLLVRLRGRALAWLAGRGAGRRARGAGSLLLASASRRAAALNRGLLLVGLLLAFGVELGLFTATYDHQAQVDAELTIGADVVVSGPSQQGLERKVQSVKGVQGTSAVDHSYAYVGPDLQDVYGINPGTIGKATTLRDSYFVGGGKSTMLSRLKQDPRGILVSAETIADYSLRQGDLLKLRVLNQRTGAFRVVPFHVVGVVQEFPSAPRDSFMVANLGYLQSADQSGGPNVVFAKAPGDPPAVARRVARAAPGTAVKDIRQQAAQTVSSITTVDLSGIASIEEAFAVVLAAAGMALFVAVALAERRHELALMTALGAPLRSVGSFLWSEAALVVAAAVVLAAGLGLLLALMLVAMLRHVFDPPPDALAVPWRFLAELIGAALAATALGAWLAGRGVRRLRLGMLLRER